MDNSFQMRSDSVLGTIYYDSLSVVRFETVIALIFENIWFQINVERWFRVEEVNLKFLGPDHVHEPRAAA